MCHLSESLQSVRVAARRLLRAWLFGVVASGIYALVSMPALAQTADETVSETASSGVQMRFELRFRYAHIEESDKSAFTNAPTLRAVLVADVKLTPQFGATMELIHTDFFGNKRFNDNPAVIGSSPFPLLPDPRYTDSNELFAKWTPSSDWTAKFGRQRVKLGNERHVSDDNFRNLPQLLDGVLLVGTPLDRTQLKLGQFNRLRTRLGPSEPTRLTIAELATNPLEDLSVTAYAIRHRPQAQPFDAARYGAADRSNWVFGAVADGSIPFTNFTTYYTLEVARQRATASGSEAVRANYWRGGLGIGYGGLIVRADHERRGSNEGRYGFQMPLT
ncbi:MAG: hypothetical protein ACRDAM_12925, partial [Casimicrobium sp.]